MELVYPINCPNIICIKTWFYIGSPHLHNNTTTLAQPNHVVLLVEFLHSLWLDRNHVVFMRAQAFTPSEHIFQSTVTHAFHHSTYNITEQTTPFSTRSSTTSHHHGCTLAMATSSAPLLYSKNYLKHRWKFDFPLFSTTFVSST